MFMYVLIVSTASHQNTIKAPLISISKLKLRIYMYSWSICLSKFGLHINYYEQFILLNNMV